jgi:large subunit ribosomal protein L13
MKDRKNNKTFMLKPADVKRAWLVLDASGKTLGRFAAEVAKILRGKHKPDYTPHADCGDGVIVINADQIRVTGDKEVQKIYRYYTGSPGGLREVPYRVMKARKPGYIIENAVKGMMPSNRLTSPQLKRLRVVAGSDHGMTAQKPIQVNV